MKPIYLFIASLLQLVLLLHASAQEAIVSNEAKPWEASPEVVSKKSKGNNVFNYVEANVPKYELPDSLKDGAGNRVATKQQWTSSRRTELLELFREHVYGRRPKTPYQVRYEKTDLVNDAFDDVAICYSLKVIISIKKREFSFPVTVFVPKKIEKPVPAVILVNNRYFVSQETALKKTDPFWPVETMIQRGYATACFHTSDVDPDKKDGYSDGIRSFFSDGKPPEDTDWRCLSSWGWAASRVLDHLELVPQIDKEKVAIVGHSRGGKTALWAACEDERFAIAYSNNSGCGGAALSRRAYGETVARITDSFPHWFAKSFSKYAGRENELPVDQHQVISLVAPRAVYVTSADVDLWADPKGEYTSLVSAAPVFRLLGKDSVSEPTMPSLNRPRTRGQTGYHVRTGGHGLELQDWSWFLDFADDVLEKR